jgi:predicted dehydrogenase
MRDNPNMSGIDRPLRVAVAGCGAFGRNHARVYRDLERDRGLKVKFVGVVDVDRARAGSTAQEFGTQAFGSLAELIANGADVVSVAVPTVAHLAVARQLMEAGIDVLIEKPLAATLAEANELKEIATQHGRIAQVGHLERFNPAVRATLPLVTTPMFFEVHRLSVFTPRSLDVDVVLDLMIHDIDIVLTMAKSPVKEVRAVGLPILSKKVDIANVRLEFASGCVANFTASRVSTERVRKLRLFQPRQYVSLDFSRQDVLVLTVDADKASSADFDPFNPSSVASSAYAGITPFKPAIEPQEPLRAELMSVLTAVRHRTAPEVSLEQARDALEVALRIVEEIARHSKRAHLEELTGSVS